MPNTSIHGIYYPDSSGTVNLWEHHQAQAESVETALEASYESSFTTYTPVLTNFGTATFSTITGYWRYIGPKLVFVDIYIVVNAAGSGSTAMTITLPTSPYRTLRQLIPCAYEDMVSASANGGGSIICFVGGSGAVADRIRVSDPASNTYLNLDGADLRAGGIFHAQGIYREA